TGGTGAGSGVDQLTTGFSTGFERGAILWSAPTGAHAVRGALAEAFHARGGVGSTGVPRGEEFGPLVRGGYGQVFTGGTLYWTPATGAHLVRDGLLMDRWARQGWETGELGYPVSEQFGEEGYAPRWQHFQGGSIYFAKPSTVVVKGAIRELYRSLGAEASPLGFPRGEEERHGDGARQVFSGGTITWSPVSGTAVDFG
ncbi:LGFP repeat-containing protein, partial [Kineococcus indalonis]|uniref:LGFP repeat-containing protein n=1 Tax=Kineococcus indalonis TaxID=2696566 RepID=UPI001F112871